MTLHTMVYRSIPVFSGLLKNYIFEIDQILSTSRRRNETQGVTGALLFNEDRFVQLLEGEEFDVKSTFERIALYSRHEAVELLFDQNTKERRFPAWSMAFVGQAAAVREKFADSPLTKSSVTMRGDQVVDFIVKLVSSDSRSIGSIRNGE